MLVVDRSGKALVPHACRTVGEAWYGSLFMGQAERSVARASVGNSKQTAARRPSTHTTSPRTVRWQKVPTGSAVPLANAMIFMCVTPPCLLYTSDADDDLLCVDLGG